MGRKPCCDKDGVKKGPWTPEEDQELIDHIQKHGPGNWRTLPKKAGLQRCGKSCRLRWANYLRPDIKRGKFSSEEEEAIIKLHSILGNKWSAIAAKLPGRTDNEIKNYWNTHIRKRLLRMGIDPVTHGPRLDLHDLSSFLTSLQTINSSFPNWQTLLNYPQLLSFGNPIMGNILLPTQFLNIPQMEPNLEQNPSKNNSNFEVKTEEMFENCYTPNHANLCPLSTSSDNSAFVSNNSGSNSLSSLFSTPGSSSLDRLDSGLAYFISSASSEDDIESYFGNMVNKFEIPSTLDVCTL